MTLKNHIVRISLNITLLIAIFASVFFNPITTLAMGSSETTLPSFTDFSQAVQNGRVNILRGVYVSNVLALPVVQQPKRNSIYVSKNNGVATQFAMASQYGNVGLLAHNNLSGKSFSQLSVGQEVRLVYGDGKVEYFVISEVLKFQALQPNNPGSRFRDLDTQETLTAGQLFKRVYSGDRHVTFQTCIEYDKNLSWGRLFVIAIPVSNYDRSDQ